MKQLIAVNSKNTGDQSKDNRGYAESWTSEQLDGLLSEDWLRKKVADIRGGNEKLKDWLPFICPHYSAFRNNHRAQADIIPDTFTFMTCVDVDDKELVDTAIQRAFELNEDPDGDWYDQVLRMEHSARKKVHIYIRIPKGMTIEEAQKAFCQELDVPYDVSCITPERFIYLTGKDEEIYRSAHWLEQLSDEELAERREAYLNRGLDVDGRPLKQDSPAGNHTAEKTLNPPTAQLTYHGIPYSTIINEWLEDKKVKAGDRHRTSLTLADQLRYITDNDASLIERILRETPFVKEIIEERQENVTKTVQDAQKFDFLHNTPKRMQAALKRAGVVADDEADSDPLEEMPLPQLPRMPQGVKESIDAVGPNLMMPVVTAICPVIGMLATGVKLDVHGVKNTLNLIAYIVGDFGSGKGKIDPVVDAWTAELMQQEKIYQDQEDEWRAKMLANKNKKEQPVEPKLPVRLLTLNNTVANIAERLANTDEKHAFSFTPEADTVAKQWKSSVNDFSVMVRQSYDGSRYYREARSAEAVNVHIERLLWNITMCGTPDALYRVVNNYTDGFQSRIAVAKTPDNTYMPLEVTPYVLTDRQAERIQQVAHLLPLMQGEVTLNKLETKGREWVENVRVESLKSDDKVRARQRFRVCVTTQRMICCLMLCKVCETLIQKHGYQGAEKLLKTKPHVWKEQLQKAQTQQLLEAYDVVADYLIDTALYFFRERIENAFSSRNYVNATDRQRIGKNDSIFARLDVDFGFEGALQHSISLKGGDVSRNQVRMMLKNWKKQGLIVQTETGRYRKVQEVCH